MNSISLKSENSVALLNISATFIVAAINFITIPIFTRMLDTDSYGVVSLYIAWVQIFTVFIGLKCDGSIASAKANLPDEEQDSYQFSIMLLSLISFGVILAFSLVFIGPLGAAVGLSSVMCVCMIMQSFGAFIVSFFNMRFIFRKDALYNFCLSVFICLATTVASIALILYAPFEGALGRALGLMIPNFLIGVCLLMTLIRKKPGFSTKYWRFCLPLTLPLIFHGLSQLVLSQVNKISLQHFCDYTAVGIFSLGVTIAGLIGMVYNALNNAYVPFFYDDLAEKSEAGKKQEHFRNYFILFTLGTISFMLLAPEVLKIMSTEDYYPAIKYLPLLIVGQYCVFLYSFPVNYEFYLKKTISIAIGTAGAAAENIILSILLVPEFGMFGAAVASTISYFSLFLFHFLIARFFYGDRNFSAFYYFVGLSLVLMVALLAANLNDSVILRWALGLTILIVALGRCFVKKRIF